MGYRSVHEAPLSPEDVKTILAICSPKGLLVGGQALAFWADRLAIELPPALVPTVTADADFIGDSALAKELGRRLGWKTWLPSLDEATPHTGKVTQRLKDGGVKQVDFLSGVTGLATKDLVRRAVELEVPRIGLVRVMHPLDVLDSRIQNLHLLPEKRTRAGIAQAEVAVDVVRAFIRDAIARKGERVGLKLLERIVEITNDIAAVRVFLLHGIDPLQAVPLDAFRTTPKLHQQRWPQIQGEIQRTRDASRQSLRRSRSR
jgi:hypothetical protein